MKVIRVAVMGSGFALGLFAQTAPLATSYSSLAGAIAATTSGQTLTLPKGSYAVSTGIRIGVPNLTLHCEPGAVIQAAAGNLSLFDVSNSTNVTFDGCTFDGQFARSAYSGVTFIKASTASGLRIRNSTIQNSYGSAVQVAAGSVSIEQVTLSNVGDGKYSGTGPDAIVLGHSGPGANVTNFYIRDLTCSQVTTRDCLHVLLNADSAQLTGTIDGFFAYNQAPYAAMELQLNPLGVVHLHNILCDNMPHGGDCVSGLGGGQETIDGIVGIQPAGAVTAGSLIEAYPAMALNVGNLNLQGPWSRALLWDGIVHLTNAQIGTIGERGLPLSTAAAFTCNVAMKAPNNLGCQGSTFDDIQIAESYSGSVLGGNSGNGGTTDGVTVSNVSVVRTPGIFGPADTGWTVNVFGNGATGNGTIHYRNVSCIIEAAAIPSGFGFNCFTGYTRAVDVDGAVLINYNATPFGQMYIDGRANGLTGSSFRHLRVTNFGGSSLSKSDVINYSDNLCLQGSNKNACGARGGPGIDFTITNVPLTYSQIEAAAGNAGHVHQIVDSTTTAWGATVSGGGSGVVGIRSNGTVWTVYAQ
jgi:hypothetical protein